MSKPPFDENAPYQEQGDNVTAPVPSDTGIKPPFDPNAPSENGEETYGSPSEQAITGIEQAVSGATLGASKKLETYTGLTTPEAIKAREEENPVTATAANVLGTGAMLYGTGGLGPLYEGTGLIGKLRLGIAEGAAIGGINQATDDWSQNKPLDGQKISASAGLGALLGLAGAGIVEGGSSLLRKGTDLENLKYTKNFIPPVIENSSAPIVDAFVPQEAGIKPTSIDDILNKIELSKTSGLGVELPQKEVLNSAIGRINPELQNPVNNAQIDSLNSQAARDTYNIFKEDKDSNIGQALKDYESVQKNELVKNTDKTIADIAPHADVTNDAIQGGKTAIDAFTNQYQAEKEALQPIFQDLKAIPIFKHLEAAPVGNAAALDIVNRMTDALPNISNALELSEEGIKMKPYRTAMGIDSATYKAVHQAIDSLNESPNALEAIWNIRKGLDQNIDTTIRGQAPSEIRTLKKAMMDYMETSAPGVEVRDAFRRYAINEQNREVIEKTFGASVGSPEFGAISKVAPEKIGDKIFSDSATVNAAKKILPKKDFDTIRANWLASSKESFTNQGIFSSNRFGSFLKKKQDVLSTAFADNGGAYQKIKDLTNIMRILPDAPSVNPSGTAKTLFGMLKHKDLTNMSWLGAATNAGKGVINKVADSIKKSDMNKMLADKIVLSNGKEQLINHVQTFSDKLERGLQTLFPALTSQSRKITNGSFKLK